MIRTQVNNACGVSLQTGYQMSIVTEQVTQVSRINKPLLSKGIPQSHDDQVIVRSAIGHDHGQLNEPITS